MVRVPVLTSVTPYGWIKFGSKTLLAVVALVGDGEIFMVTLSVVESSLVVSTTFGAVSDVFVLEVL